MTTTKQDAAKIAAAFRQIQAAAAVIAEVLGSNDELNETVPTNWPLNLSADEFAAECSAMADHYEDLAAGHITLERKYRNRA
jgi:hypothetical protein